MSDDFLLGAAAMGAIILVVMHIAIWRLQRDLKWMRRAHNQRMAMIDEIQRAAGGSFELFRSMCEAMGQVKLPEHARRLRKGEPVSSISPAILWGVTKAVEGVE